jgi:hypothetical protein
LAEISKKNIVDWEVRRNETKNTVTLLYRADVQLIKEQLE